MYRAASLLMALLVARASTAPASLRALLPGLDWSAPGIYASSSLYSGYGFLHFSVDSIPEPPLHTPWALLTYLNIQNLEKSLISAGEKNASAVIVAVDRLIPDTRLVSHYLMKTANNDKYIRKLLEIPVITIGKSSGDYLVAVTRTFGKVPVFISPDEIIRDKTGFFLLIAISPVAIIMYIFTYQVWGQKEGRIPVSIIACPYQSAVSNIPTQELSDPHDPVCDEENKCAICIEGYQIKEVICELPCSHVFHKDCIEPWLMSKRHCPMCKMDVIKFYGHINLGSEESIVDIPLGEEIIITDMELDDEGIPYIEI